jgi:hypothetical protein
MAKLINFQYGFVFVHSNTQYDASEAVNNALCAQHAVAMALVWPDPPHVSLIICHLSSPCTYGVFVYVWRSCVCGQRCCL